MLRCRARAGTGDTIGDATGETTGACFTGARPVRANCELLFIAVRIDVGERSGVVGVTVGFTVGVAVATIGDFADGEFVVDVIGDAGVCCK